MSSPINNYSPFILRNVKRKNIKYVSKRWIQILKKRERAELLSRLENITNMEGMYSNFCLC